MSIVYVRTFKMWAYADEVRRNQPMQFLVTQFDQMLAAPVPGQMSTPESEADFINDYKALQGMGD